MSDELTSGVASLPIPDPDDVDSDNDPTNFVKPGKKGKGEMEDTPEYILGTLVIRVVAAKDLDTPKSGGGFGLFGSPLRKSMSLANPYASVKFGNATQRTSEVFDTLDPIWPRQETMFMDVSLPLSKITHPQIEDSRSDAASVSVINDSSPQDEKYSKPNSLITVAIFHNPDMGKGERYPSKGGFMSGDSDDYFLGMASADLTRLLTGTDHTYDEWLTLSGTETARGSVRIVCEYEPSDAPPRPGDSCRFTRYCSPKDLYPLAPGGEYSVAEVDGDVVLISYMSQEGWVCSFEAHRYMLICQERHQSPVETAQDELALMTERLSHSPLVHQVTETVERVAVEGLLNVGTEIVHGGLGLLNRWLEGGVDTAISDVTNVTNWDGRYNPDNGERLDLPETMSSDSPAKDVKKFHDEPIGKALQGMPCCPITGEPMIDPVVAADGHTYERTAIARWFEASDKSPLTNAILPHKELVSNYMLLSSIQESASRAKEETITFENEEESIAGTEFYQEL